MLDYARLIFFLQTLVKMPMHKNNFRNNFSPLSITYLLRPAYVYYLLHNCQVAMLAAWANRCSVALHQRNAENDTRYTSITPDIPPEIKWKKLERLYLNIFYMKWMV